MKKKNNLDILTGVLKATQMAQVGIRGVLRGNMHPELRMALNDQLKEYDSIESEAMSIAKDRGWKLKPLDPAFEFMAERMTKLKLGSKLADSKIADMMIQGNTQGMIKSLRDLHRYHGSDLVVSTLGQKLLSTETANIRQMKPYL